MGNIYVSPLGGIGNQLRMIVSTKLLADYLKYDHFVVDWVENNRYPGFDSLYKTDDTFKVSSVVPNNAKFVDLTKETIILDEINKFENIIIKGYHYVGANTVLYGLPQEQQNKWFIEYKNGYQKLQLKDDIKLKIPKLPENTIGLQIRRGDNQRSNDNSPTNLFIKKIVNIKWYVFIYLTLILKYN